MATTKKTEKKPATKVATKAEPHQHGPRGYPALFDSDQEDAECPGLDVPLVVGR